MVTNHSKNYNLLKSTIQSKQNRKHFDTKNGASL